MEDRVLATRLNSGDLFMGVYDGHCGEGCPEYCKQHWQQAMVALPEFGAGDTGAALKKVYHKINDDFAIAAAQDDISGTTAVCAVVRGDTLTVSNVGDSRAVIQSGGVARAITHDHKPEDEVEMARITAAGGSCDFGGIVAPSGGNFLKCARSIGDVQYKCGPAKYKYGLPNATRVPSRDHICADADVFTIELTAADEFVIMCSDGVWDVLSDAKACEIVAESLRETDNACDQAVCVRLAHKPTTQNG
jgi:protein phosphatase 2C family protein 2/3